MVPNEKIEGIKPNWPYLFKESIYRYPDQFWTELIAFIVSKHLGVNVPLVCPAKTVSDEGATSGSLIEWFYDVNTERFLHAGVYYKRLIPDFDDKTGKQHNIKDFFGLTKYFSQQQALTDNVIEWFMDMALFDVLIGNTDRHQENWGIIFKPDKICSLSPLFDNGTSLGHERFIENIQGWDDQRIRAYASKGRHHFRLNKDDGNKRIKHFELIKWLVSVDERKKYMSLKLTSLNMSLMLAEVEKLTLIPNEIPFEKERFSWIKKVIQIRYELIQEAIK